MASSEGSDPAEELSLDPIKLSEIEVRHSNERRAEFIVTSPAFASGSAAALRTLSKLSVEQGTGSHRPSKVLVGMNRAKTQVYFIPMVASDSEDALTVIYTRSGFTLNLIKLFTILDRRVQKGFRDIYHCEPSRNPVSIGAVTGRALVMNLPTYSREPVHELTAEQKAKRKRKANNSSNDA